MFGVSAGGPVYSSCQTWVPTSTQAECSNRNPRWHDPCHAEHSRGIRPPRTCDVAPVMLPDLLGFWVPIQSAVGGMHEVWLAAEKRKDSASRCVPRWPRCNCTKGSWVTFPCCDVTMWERPLSPRAQPSEQLWRCTRCCAPNPDLRWWALAPPAVQLLFASKVRLHDEALLPSWTNSVVSNVCGVDGRKISSFVSRSWLPTWGLPWSVDPSSSKGQSPANHGLSCVSEVNEWKWMHNCSIAPFGANEAGSCAERAAAG